jgi:hypothetical protein
MPHGTSSTTHPALLAVDPSHAIDQKNQIAPEADELKPPRRGRLVVAGRGLMTARANGSGSFPRPDRDEDGLLVFGKAGLPVDKSRDGMALVQNSGKAHEVVWIDRKMKTNPDSLPLTPAALLPYCRDCRDLSEWPERWMGEEKDLPPGRNSSNTSCPSSFTSPSPACRKEPSKTTSTICGCSAGRSSAT